jgi:hypothetical protein
MFRFTIRDLLWLTVVVVSCGGDLAQYRATAQQPSVSPANDLKAKSNKQLIDHLSLSRSDTDLQIAALNELVKRGKNVMPNVLRSLEANEQNINDLAILFAAMGPNAESALPFLLARITNKEYVYTAVMMADKLKPGTVASLPDSTKQQAAGALYEATIESEGEMVGSHIVILTTLGKPAAPTLLRLLRHKSGHVRYQTIECLYGFAFVDRVIASEVGKLSQEDPSESVRMVATTAAQHFATKQPAAAPNAK